WIEPTLSPSMMAPSARTRAPWRFLASTSFAPGTIMPRSISSENATRGMIVPGAKLVDAKKRHGALVRADGAIMLGDKVGSIHRIGAVAQGSGACNGWTFWHVETKTGLRLIDELRAEIRSGMAVG
ncbi:MAG: hypothetical protein ACK5E0_36695, partial [Bradyrhizobium sp.]